MNSVVMLHQFSPYNTQLLYTSFKYLLQPLSVSNDPPRKQTPTIPIFLLRTLRFRAAEHTLVQESMLSHQLVVSL